MTFSPASDFERLRPVAERSARWTYYQNRRRLPPSFGIDDATQEGLLKLWTLCQTFSSVPTPGLVAVAVKNRILDVALRTRATECLGDRDVPETGATLDATAAREWLDEVLPTAPASVRGFIDAKVRRDGSATRYHRGDADIYHWAAAWLRDHHWRK